MASSSPSFSIIALHTFPSSECHLSPDKLVHHFPRAASHLFPAHICKLSRALCIISLALICVSLPSPLNLMLSTYFINQLFYSSSHAKVEMLHEMRATRCLYRKHMRHNPLVYYYSMFAVLQTVPVTVFMSEPMGNNILRDTLSNTFLTPSSLMPAALPALIHFVILSTLNAFFSWTQSL